MKVAIFAGGLGTRLSEETTIIPKPMLHIAGKPILWHIMKSYAKYGFTDFVVLVGYKSYVIKEYFVNYCLHQSDVTIDLAKNEVQFISSSSEPWKVTLLDTGDSTLTGTRLAKAQRYLENDTFLLTYGDGLSDIDMKTQISYHRSHGGIVTMTAVQPAGRFGTFVSDPDTNAVVSFTEKPAGDGSWINGGYFVCEPTIFSYLPSDNNYAFEETPLQSLARDGRLFTYKHNGFWKCMDTLRDKQELELIASNSPCWLD